MKYMLLIYSTEARRNSTRSRGEQNAILGEYMAICWTSPT